MSKPLFLISFANHDTQPLPHLDREKEEVEKIIIDRQQKQDFEVTWAPTRTAIIEVLENPIKSENLVLFSYSGHAARDRLITEGEPTRSKGIAQLLSECRNLKLIILNGCSTKGQIQELTEAFKKTGNSTPIMVATTASVGDRLAADFGIALTKQLLLFGRFVNNAFDLAISVVDTQLGSEKLKVVRFLDEMQEEGTWGIYGANEKDKTDFTINQVLATTYASTYQPNNRLFKELIKELSNHNTEIKKRYLNAKKIIMNINPYKMDIYKSFPFPISRRLQRLDSSESSVDANWKEPNFYNRVDRHRLGELLRVFQTIIDILNSIAQAELYSLINKTPHLIKRDRLAKLIATYHGQNNLLGGYTAIEIFKDVVGVLYEQRSLLFTQELALFHEVAKQEFFALGNYFKKLQSVYSTLSNQEAEGLVELTEMKLIQVFRHITFLTAYNLTSVENILLNRRRVQNVTYYHQLFRQQWSGLEPTLDYETLETYLDHSSIILHKANLTELGEYLNLSPFLIDEVLFQEKATVSNLMTFSGLKADLEIYKYRYLIFSNIDNETRKVMFIETSGGGNEIEYQNKAFAEIREEWTNYLTLIDKLP